MSVTPKGVIGVVNKDNSRGAREGDRYLLVSHQHVAEREFGLGRKGGRWMGGEKEEDK